MRFESVFERNVRLLIIYSKYLRIDMFCINPPKTKLNSQNIVHLISLKITNDNRMATGGKKTYDKEH